MQSELLQKRQFRIAVVGVAYWAKNLVRNFHDLGALAAFARSQTLPDTDTDTETHRRLRFLAIAPDDHDARLIGDAAP